MGSVKFQTRNDYKGLEQWRYVTQSDERTIAHLIRNRGRLDDSYYASMFDGGGIIETNGVFPFSEPVLVAYIDLDRLIADTDLEQMEKLTVDKLMMGYTLLDLEEIYGISRKVFGNYFASACRKLKNTNDRHWAKVYAKRDTKPAQFPNYYREGDVSSH